MAIINSFPGYTYVPFGDDAKPHNLYRGEDVGFGGYVYAEPGMYGRTVCFDVSGMHPASIRALNYLGEYTKNYADLVEARTAIKHKDFDAARKMLDGKLAPYLTDETQAKALSNALKLAQNSVYGLTSANFTNPFRDPRNNNNIVALRGALMMINLKHEIQDRGFKVIHCKTDSCKVVEPTDELAEFIVDYGKQYGYNFEIEHIFERICLVNNAVYIAKLAADDPDAPGQWTATGAQFAVPYIFKKLFSKEPIEFSDLCETKEVKTTLYLDMNESLPDATQLVKEKNKLWKDITNMNLPHDEKMQAKCDRVEELTRLIDECHDYKFIGRVGLFCPILPGRGGGELLRMSKDKDGNTKYDSVTGTKGYRWLEAEMVKELGKEDDIDRSYYDKLVDDAIENISQYGDFEWFVSDDSETDIPEQTDTDHPTEFDLPWKTTCGKDTCFGCPNLKEIGQGDFYECAKGYDISDLIAYAQQLYGDDGDIFNKR